MKSLAQASVRTLARWLRALAGAAVLAGVALPAHADAVDDMVPFLADALGEPALKDAAVLIRCVIDKGPEACVDVAGMIKDEATQAGKAAAKQFMPDDPRIKTAVEIVKAAYAQDLLKVLELAGVEFLPQLACSTALAASGPLKAACKPLLEPLKQLAKPVAKVALTAILDPTLEHLLALVAVIDLDLACTLVKIDIPGKNEVCGTLGQVVQVMKDLGSKAAEAGMAVGEFAVQSGEAIVAAPLAAAKGLCKLLGGCDDSDSNKRISFDAYYKYVLFPRIHDRIVARLVHGQQQLGHDLASMQMCKKYYGYDVYAALAPPQAAEILKGCTGAGERLHKDADTLARAFGAAPAGYMEGVVRPLVPTMAVEGYGQNKLPGFRKFVTGFCVTSLRKQFAIVEPTQPGTTAWDFACNKVGAAFETAYQAQEKVLATELAKLALYGVCKMPAGWNVADKGVKLVCDSYPGHLYCLKTLAPGKEKWRCNVDQAAADKKLAQKVVASLGSKRCQANAAAVACTRPWKADSCKALVAGAAPTGMTAGTKCTADLVAFAVQETRADQFIAALNGIKPAGGTVGANGKSQGLALVTPGGGAGCAQTWDPLAIHCKDLSRWQQQVAAQPTLQLPHCAADASHDGADAPCYSMPLSAHGGAPQNVMPANPAAPVAATSPARGNGLPTAVAQPVRQPPALPPSTTRAGGPLAPTASILPPPARLGSTQPVGTLAPLASTQGAGDAMAPGCTRVAPGRRLSCRDAAALARCEALRRQHRVDACLAARD